MRIEVVGNEDQLGKCRNRWFSHDVAQVSSKDIKADVLVLFDNDGLASHKELLSLGIPVLASTVLTTIAELQSLASPKSKIFGFNGEASFFDREIMELTALPEDEESLKKLLSGFEDSFEIVKDQVGMVTPRIIAMIINEAYFTVEEQTATREDIDLGMKLGTNYPMGPFEWKDAWGIDRIYKLLSTLKKATGDSRYEICPLLQSEYEASVS